MVLLKRQINYDDDDNDGIEIFTASAHENKEEGNVLWNKDSIYLSHLLKGFIGLIPYYPRYTNPGGIHWVSNVNISQKWCISKHGMAGNFNYIAQCKYINSISFNITYSKRDFFRGSPFKGDPFR